MTHKSRGKTIGKILLILSLALIVMAIGCIREAKEPKWAYGRVLTLRVLEPDLIQEFSFIDNRPDKCATPENLATCTTYTVSSSDPDRLLAATHVRVVNEKSAAALLLIDTEAAYVEDRSGNRYPAIDPWEHISQAVNPLTKQSKLVPFLQGEYTLEKDLQIEGWMFFTVPRGVKVYSLSWSEGDDIRVPLSR